MFYLDIWKGYLPEWFPGMGGEYYSLWPIFNIADASIFVGVAIILIMQKRYFAHHTEPEPPASIEEPTIETTSGSDNESKPGSAYDVTSSI
jgi:signal peptidase II